MRITAIDYLYFVWYFANLSERHDSRQSGGLVATWFFVSSVANTLLDIFSRNIVDVRSWLIAVYPWQSDAYKSPANPKTFPITICMLVAGLLMFYWFRGVQTSTIRGSFVFRGPRRLVALTMFAVAVQGIVLESPEVRALIFVVAIAWLAILGRSARTQLV